MDRKTFITTLAAASGTMAFAGGRQPKSAYDISLAQWSVRKLHWGKEEGELEFPVQAHHVIEHPTGGAAENQTCGPTSMKDI